jgi:hypothetical protein
MSAIALRDYRECDAGRCRDAFRNSRRVLYVSSTGPRKAPPFTAVCRRIVAKRHLEEREGQLERFGRGSRSVT